MKFEINQGGTQNDKIDNITLKCISFVSFDFFIDLGQSQIIFHNILTCSLKFIVHMP